MRRVKILKVILGAGRVCSDW